MEELVGIDPIFAGYGGNRIAPGCSVSSTMARFSSAVHRRRRWTEVMPSMGFAFGLRVVI